MIFENFWKNKKVFLTGHTGYKGSWLSLYLQTLGAMVVGYAQSPSTTRDLFYVARVNEGRTNSFQGDVCAFDELLAAIQATNPDIVIHMAAQALVRESYENPLETYQTNILGTANILECIRFCDSIKAAVIVTTDKCYENRNLMRGYKEEDMLGGYDPYSASKACAELVTASYRRSFLAEHGVAVATARAGNVIGGGDWAKDRLIPDCFRAIEGGECIQVRNPDAVRPWQHVLEPLHGYLMLAKALYEEGDRWAESWNFGPEDERILTVGDIVKEICCRCGGRFVIGESNTVHEAKYLRLDATKARQKLGWRSKLDIEETLEWTMDWYNGYYEHQDMRDFTMRQIDFYREKLSSI